MQNTELIFVNSRARKLNNIMYLAAIAVKGTEDGKHGPQFVVYGNHPALLKILVDDHNEMVKVRKTKQTSKSK